MEESLKVFSLMKSFYQKIENNKNLWVFSKKFLASVKIWFIGGNSNFKVKFQCFSKISGFYPILVFFW